MHIKNIHSMIEKLSEVAKCELDKGVENIDTKEMREVAEIIKELSEAEYYAKISKAMDESEYGEDYDYMGAYDEHSRKGYRGQPRDSKGRYMRRRYTEPMRIMPDMDWDNTEYNRDMDRMSDNRMYYTEPMSESKYDMAKHNYMKSREMHKDNSPESKQHKMKELENYVKELSTDISDMISDMTPEEKSMLKQKMSMLMQKM